MNRLVLILVGIIASTCLHGQINQVPSIEADGPTGKMLYSGDTVIITGNFKHVYQPDSSNHYFSYVDAPYAGSQKANLWPNAPVTEVVEDGKGGHILFGSFTQIGDSLRGGIAHIDSNGSLSPLFAGVSINGTVNCAAVSGDTLFVGGKFSSVNYDTDRSVWILDSTNFQLKNKTEIKSGARLAIDDGQGGWYVSGYFPFGSKYGQYGIWHVDSLGHTFDIPFNYYGTIYAMKRVQNELYLLGDFSLINGVSGKEYIVVLDLATYERKNTLWSFNKRITGAYPVGTDSLLVWGDFDTISGVARSGFGLIGLTSYYVGTLNKKFYGGINRVQVSGRQVIVQGSFTRVDQNSYNGLCLFDMHNGQKRSWDPLTSTNYQNSGDVIILHDTLLYVCGYFDKVNGQPRKNMACFKLGLGSNPTLLPWAPQPNGIPRSYYYSGGNLYVQVDTGYLSNIGNRKVIFSVDRSDTARLFEHGLKVSTEPITIPSGNALLAMSFVDLNYQYRKSVALFSLSDGSLLDDILECDEAYTIHVDEENIYLGGAFISVNNQYTKGIASVNRNTLKMNAITPFNNFTTVKIQSIATYQNMLIVGGALTYYALPDIQNFAFIDKQTGAILSPSPKVAGYTNKLIVKDSTLYAAGSFAWVDGKVRKGFFAYDLKNFTVLDDSLDMDSMVYDMEIKGDTLALVGSFTRINNQSMPNFAVYSLRTKTLLSSAYAIGEGRPRRICRANNGFAIGGEFRNIGGKRRYGIAAFNPRTMQIYPWAPYKKGNIYHWVMNENDLFFSGVMDSVGSIKANHRDVYAIDRYSDTLKLLHQFVLSNSGFVGSLFMDHDTLYIGGKFTSVDGQAKNSIALIHTNNYSSIAWNPSGTFTGTVYSLFAYEDKLYVGGAFNSIGGASRNYLARLNLSNGIADSWNPNLNSSIGSMTYSEELQFYTGSFNSAFSSKRYGGNLAISMDGNLDSFTSSDDAIFPQAEGELFYAKRNGAIRMGPKFRATDFQYGNPYGFSFGVGEIIKMGDTVMISGNLNYANNSAYNLIEYPEYGNFIATRAINYIWADTLPSSFCRGTDYRIPIHIQGEFNADNKFLIQLSDSQGLFKYPYVYTMSKVDSFENDELFVNFHKNLPNGTKYQLQVVSTSPYAVYPLGYQKFSIDGATSLSNFFINDKIQCEGANEFLAIDTMGATTFSFWELNGDTTTRNHTDSFELNLPKQGVYTISRIRIDGLGCRDSIAKQVDVKYRPFALIWSPIDWDYCFDSVGYLFTGLSVPLDSFHFAEWNISNIAGWNTVYGDTMEYTFSEAGSYQVEYIVHNTYECYDTMAITFNLYDYPNAEVLLSDSNACLNDSLEFFTNPLYTHPYYEHTWSFGDANSDSVPNPVHAYNGAQTYKVTHRIETYLGCNDEQSREVVVHDLPSGSFTVSDTLNCPSDSGFTLIAQGIGKAPFDYTWMMNDSQLWNKRIFIYQPDSHGVYTMTLGVQDSLGCKNTVDRSFEWLPPFDPKIAMNDSVVCEGDSIQVEALETAGSYFWLIDGKQELADSQQVYYARQSMDIQLLTLRKGRCYDSSNLVSPEILPYTIAPKLSKQGDSLNAGTYDHYFWNKLGNWSMADTFQYLWTQQEGDYFVEVTDNGKCPAYSDTVNVLFTRLSSKITHEDLRLYPNPNKGKFIIESNSVHIRKARLYSSLGMLLYENIELNKEQDMVLLPGTYWIAIEGADSSVWLKMIVIE